MITVESLTRRYASFTAVDNISFTARPGRVTGFLGPNGAGKSTTMRVMVGLTAPTSGSATIDGDTITHDVIIRLGGRVEKRKKKLSKAVYGTSHIISLAEAEHLYQDEVERLLIGAGQEGRVALSEEAAAYFARNRCQVELLPTPEVIPVWNQAEGAVIGLLHVTC